MSREDATKPSVSGSNSYNTANKTKALKVLSKYIKESDILDGIGEGLAVKYKEDNEKFNFHLRQILAGLRKNKKLVDNLCSKKVTPNELIEMSPDDMADEAVKEIKERIIKDEEDKKKPIDISKIPDNNEFKCGKCGSRKIQETLAQTRSADEPMTRFLTCASCGFFWKMSC
ncbi:transcription elongation factor S-II, putative [Entamoeba histolytica HM-3:IMSS]|uniref:Transcription elongation factor S-II, putative n=1 Tax=Entamoeba histolytica HM-3:IMSS TaxID=885315 RepID=M7W6B8_ENTHI|nr:transcription elongation factor S-II, putative [Entamoeba histolytica HM-3:IMSS]